MKVPLGIESVPLSRIPNVRHAFSSRVLDRDALLADALGPQGDGPGRGRIVTLKQVHGARIFEVGRDGDGRSVPEGYDAAISDRPGVAVGILTADCVPVLLANDAGTVVAAAHAGWRGTAAGIVARLVARLAERGDAPPASLRAAIGPAIGPCCFEVGPEVVEELAKRCPDPEAWTRTSPGARPHVDLVEVNRRQLVEAGLALEHIDAVDRCTRCEGEVFASYRREGEAAGRQLSVIGLRAEEPPPGSVE